VPWQGDGLELFIEKVWERAAGWTRNGVQYGFCPDTAGEGGKARFVVAWGDTAGSGRISAAWQKSAKGYALEAFIPAKSLGAKALTAGTTWGFNFSRDDDGRAVEQFFSDKEKDQGFITPVLWGAVTLAP